MTGAQEVAGLIARLEAATELTLELFLEVQAVLRPDISEEDWSRTFAMAMADAWESAALTLVPEGCTVSINIDRDRQSEVTLESGWDAFVGYAPTPALAICIAALKARP